MKRAIRFAFATAFLTAFVATLAHAQDFKKQVIYQIVTDRFYNGDTSNDNPPQSSGLFDSTQTNWNLYWAVISLVFRLSSPTSTAWVSPPCGSRLRWTTST